MRSLIIKPVEAVEGDVTLPGSKSISNRALLLAAEAEGQTRLVNLLASDDTTRMLTALGQLDIRVLEDGDDHLVTGVAGPLVRDDRRLSLDLGLAGTALRPLTAALTLGNGVFDLDGTPRMRERPIAHLVDGLRQLGARIRYTGREGFPPIEVTGTGLRGGRVTMQGSVSSQFLTSLLLAAPLAAAPVEVLVEGEQVSKPYLDITVEMMGRFGATVGHEDHRVFRVEPGGYRSPGRYLIEGDASAASYFLAAGAIAGGGVCVHGIGSGSVQGDMAFVEVLEAMGARVTVAAEWVRVEPGQLAGVDLDLNHIPDAAMTAAVLALFADGPTRIRNIYNWRVKETDRLAAMATELKKVGAEVVESEDSLTVNPPKNLNAATIDTYDDHRMAMCFSLAALGGVEITINDPDCVSKTFPRYFQEFERLARR
ncbi:MAG: 3-phosphoshikimate 1-carboxyvinyltransferase [Pseudomonadales bacterium]|nr:3-phosphoshikimate 1-carboxyvinyltransferase [Pseudomonadales bacterium]NIX09643.1 3-phosphoshikimate 1-carboxyvinyltransferase [Pseudomonadales bacterium]